MKRVLKFSFILFALMFLVSCMDNYKEIDLSYDEAKEELSGVEIAEKDTLELDLDLLLEFKDNDGFVDLKGNVLLNNNQIVLDLNLNMQMEDLNADGKGLLYLVDDGIYFDGNLNVESEMLNLDIDGKKKLTELSNNFEDEFDINELLDLDLDDLVNDHDFKKLVEEYEGLTFYKSNNKLKLELIVNKELVEKHKELFEKDGLLELDEDVSLTLELIIEDKKVTSFNLDLNMKENDIKINLKINAKLSSKKLNLPNFEDFENIEFE